MNVKIKIITALFAFTVFGAVLTKGADRPAKPEFAFPDKVAADADKSLNRALAEGDGREVVHSLVCYSLARNAVSPSLLPPVIERIDSVASAENDPCVRSLLYLLEAQIYNGLYNRDKWRYDERQIPVDSVSADYTEWSGEQFKRRIGGLLEKATEPREALAASQLSDWKDIIESNEYTFIFYPTLYDLVAYNAISIYTSMAQSDAVLPFRFVYPELVLQAIPVIARVDGYSRRAHEICLDLVGVHKGHPAPEITARLCAVSCMQSLVVGNNRDNVDKTYMAIYHEFANSEFADEALIACTESNNTEYINLVRAALDRFPKYFRADALRQRVSDAERTSLNYSISGNVTPGHPFKLKVTLENASAARLMFYRDPNGMNGKMPANRVTDAMRSAATSHAVTVAPRPKPYKTDTTLTITLSDPGRYFVWGEIDGVAPKERAPFDVLLCTDLAPITFGYDGEIYPYAVNSFTGKPLQGIKISGNNRADNFIDLGVTGNDGSLDKPLSHYGRLKLTSGNQTIRYNAPWSYRPERQTKWRTEASFFTSLSLYHPGDSIEWAVVMHRYLNGRHEVAPNERILIKIFDTNNQCVDSARAVTDATGRAEGKFKISSDGISGIYTASIFDHNEDGCGWGQFMVNDYKLPTFNVDVTDITRSTNPDSAVVITCKAETYSLMPLDDAKVNVELREMPCYWWGRENRPFWSADSVTAPGGTFKLVIPRELLDLAPNGNSRFMVTFNVTSAGGETRSCFRIFNTGKPYIITANDTDDFELKSPFNLGVNVVDATGKNVSIPLKYTLMDDSVKVAEFTDVISPDKIKSGVYDIIIAPVDTTLADALKKKNVALYRTDGKCPCRTALYVPKTEYSVTTDYVDIIIGSSVDSSNVLAAVTVDDKLVKREWIELAKGMRTYRIDIPADCNRVQVLFNNVYDNRQKNYTVTVINLRAVMKLDVELESFRNRVIPNTPENISLKVRLNGSPIRSSVLMLMESEAILQILPHNLDLNLSRWWLPSFDNGRYRNYLSGSVSVSVKKYQWSSITVPALDLYGYIFSSSFNSGLRIRGRRYMTGATDDVNIVREHRDEVVVEEAAEAPLAMKAIGATNYDQGTDDLVTYSQEESFEGEDADTTGGADVKIPDSFNYRPSEIPLAFFAPMLSTGDDGSLTYTYTVPNANTSWSLKALAYTPDMLTASLQRTVTSSRPVMVQSTLPRFMRYGDEATLRAMVMNATDSAQVIVTTVTILNATDMSTLTTMTQTDTVAARGNVTIATPFTAPAVGQAIIYRVKSLAGNYSDGEQDVLPLLPASQPVIVSKPFYVAPDSTSFTMTIPAAGKDNSSTLYLYDNPLWEVVTALPSLRQDASVTSVGAMNDIYMAAIARGIMAKNPSLKKALKEWLESDRSSETLTSMLTRNDDLKQLSLNATPWMRDAMTDTERLSSLALMLDDSNIDRTISNGIRTLDRLAMADGGIAWCKGFERSSLWATYRVLTQIASLQERGYMPDNAKLRKITAKAISYIDKDIAETLRLNKNKGDYTQFSYIRSILHDSKLSPAARQAITITVNNILKRWEGESPQSKGIDAVILYHNNYPSMARRLVASIKAYSMTSPEKGTWWEGLGVNPAANLLYAIETVTPDDRQLIQSVAQWLIFSKTNQSWDCPSATSASIDALLGAIDVEKAVNGKAEVMLNGNKVENITPQFPGMTVADISDVIASEPATLTITTDTGLQAMGSVISRSIVAMDSIPATAHPSVSVTKRFNVVKGTAVEGVDTLRVGDRVKVQLVINVKDDLDYVTIVDRNAACLEPVDQLSGYTVKDGMWFYREVTDSETRMFIGSLSRGTYVVDTDMTVVSEGRFTSGVATLQSQINPSVAANSSARSLVVKP